MEHFSAKEQSTQSCGGERLGVQRVGAHGPRVDSQWLRARRLSLRSPGRKAGWAAWAALRAGWRRQAPQRGRQAHSDDLRSSAEPALPGRNFSSQTRVSFLPLGVRPGGGVRLGGGPSRPAPPPGRPPASWDRSARPPQAPRAPLETVRLGRAMNSGEIRRYAHANTRARTQLRCGLRARGPTPITHLRASAELGRLSYLSWGSLLLKTDK